MFERSSSVIARSFTELEDDDDKIEDDFDLESEEFKQSKQAFIELANAVSRNGSMNSSPSFTRRDHSGRSSLASSYTQPSALQFINDEEKQITTLDDQQEEPTGLSMPLIFPEHQEKAAKKSEPRMPLLSSARIRNKQRMTEEDLRDSVSRKPLPYFTLLVTLMDVVMMIVEIVVNKGVEPLSENIWLGPKISVLIQLGAKDSLLMSYEGGLQLWRFITPVFLHVGVFHLVLNMLGQIPLGFDLERSIGTWRFILIYFISGITGNMLSAIFLVRTVEAGASSSLFGLYSIYIVDYVMNWKYYRRPVRKVTFWIIGTVLSLVLGLFPGIDNFAHIGGALGGVFATMILIPRVFTSQTNVRTRYGVRIVGAVLLACYLVVGLAVFYFNVDVEDNCQWCEAFNCLPKFGDWCPQ